MGVVPRLQAWPGHSGEHRRESPVRTDKAILDGSNGYVGAAGDPWEYERIIGRTGGDLPVCFVRGQKYQKEKMKR